MSTSSDTGVPSAPSPHSRTNPAPAQDPGWLLTPLQRATVARSLVSPGGGHYIQQLVCDWTEPLQMECWRRAWEFVAGRHEALRAYFQWHGSGELTQHFTEDVAVRVVVSRAAAESVAERERVLAEFLEDDRRLGFDLVAQRLWRLTVFPWSDRECTTVWTFHHALLDGRSHALVWREFETVYRAFVAGQTPNLPPARPFREFLAWLAAAPMEPAAAYWRERLRGFNDAVGLPTLAVAPNSAVGEGPPAAETLELPADTTNLLRVAAERFGVSLNNLVQGAWALALARYQAVDDVTFGTTRAGRHWTATGSTEQVGMLINTVPFRVNTAPSQAVGAWLQSLRDQQVSVQAGEHASIEQIRHWCGMPPGAVPFRTVLMFENLDPSAAPSGATRRLRLYEKTDLPTFAAYAGLQLTMTLDYDSERYPAAQIRTVLGHIAALLKGLAGASADLSLRKVSMLTPAERQLLLDDWQGPLPAGPVSLVHRALEAQVARSPEAPAVEFLDETISYAELHQRANRLARRLLQFASPGDRIAVVLDRAHDQIFAWLAALKSGLVYAPVDPSNPRARLEFYFTDLQPAVVLTQQDLLPHLPVAAVRVLCLDSPAERAAQAALDGSNLAFEPAPAAPVNLLYTSGSTGVPKAAINSYGGLSNFAGELRRTFDVGPGDRVLQSSATSFDASLFDFVAALQVGATLVLVPSDKLRPGPELSRLLVGLRISVVLLTPTVMRSTPVPPPAVRIVISAGEPLTADLVEGWAPGRRLFNVCGPTECSVWFTCEEVRSDGHQPTIGRLVQGCRGYVLDEALQPVPVGVPGELYLGGVGVGLGYWNQPELTAERYVSDPFGGVPGAQMYCTGDRVRWLADGRIEYLGRLDLQVKFQGVRVELGEIEAALRSHPAVADAVLVPHADRLLAWLVARGPAPSPDALRAWLAGRIPLLFAPSVYQSVPAFPRTRTGKADRAALLAAWLADQTPMETPPASPPTDAERTQVLVNWNQTDRAYPTERSVVDFFQEQVSRRPDGVALKAGAKEVSYGELNRRANRVAHRLLRAGLQAEGIVALRFDRSVAFVVAALGVLKAGGAYLPLELNTPPARLEWLLADSGARFALVAAGVVENFVGWVGQVEVLNDEAAACLGETETDPAVVAAPRRRAYLVYTSGSTGRPKGVEIEHHSLTNLVCFYHERLGLTPADRVTLLANPVFDASVADLWPGLCAGATVLVPDSGLLTDPDGLIAWLATEGATLCFVPTALGELMFQRPWPQRVALRHFCVGGDTLRVRPPAGLPFDVLNTYGPTENTVDATWAVVQPEAAAGFPDIGRPIANVRAYVLDEQLAPVAPGTTAELFLGGAQVARGYLNQPELTRERFLPDPFSATPGARMYRTGDRVRWRAGGELEFLGRRDDQIQIRGQRVELGEIEATLLRHPRVREACCRPVCDGQAVASVVAHVTVTEATGDVINELREFASARLPAYMVPGTFVCHPALPLTPQGKVDRAALDGAVPAITGGGGASQPEDSLERALTQLWHRLLPDAQGGVADRTFRELGGDSLLSVRLLLGVEELTGRRLALSTFLLEPTLAGLCRAASAAEREAHRPVLSLHRRGAGVPVFCLYALGGDIGMYFDLADELSGDHPVFGVRSPALHDDQRVPESLESAARQVRQWLRQVHPKGPFALVGYSWAGLLAFEVARQCLHEERVTPFCALIGSQAPVRSRSLAVRLWHGVRWLPHWVWHFTQDRGHRWQRFVCAFSSAPRLGRTVVIGEKFAIPDFATTPLSREHIALAFRYRPRVSRPVLVHIFRERESFVGSSHPIYGASTAHEEDGGWGYWAGCRPQIHWIDGRHDNVLKPPRVSELAAELRAALAAQSLPQ